MSHPKSKLQHRFYSRPDVSQILGPPRRYFNLSDGVKNIALEYKTIGYSCGTVTLAGRIVRELMKEIGKLIDEDGVVIWRTEPEWYGNILFMRLATSPPLPSAFWKKHQKMEGANFREWGVK